MTTTAEMAGHPPARPAHQSAAPPERALSLPIVTPLLAASGAAVLLVALAVSLRHIRDRFQVNHTTGVWLALAHAFRHGSLYAPLHAGDHYGGGRYMPLGIILDGTVGKVVGSDIAGPKLVSIGVGAALVALTIYVCRRLGCDWPMAVGLAAVPLATMVGLEQVAGVRNDILPLLLELAAVALVWLRPRASSPLIAGALAGLAFAAKTTSVWGLPIVVWWCWRRYGRPAAIRAAIAGVALPATVLAACTAVSHGQLVSSVFGTSSWWPPHVAGLLLTVGQGQLQYVVGALPLLGVAALLVLLPGSLTQTPFPAALALATVITIPLFLDNGIAANHFIDVIVLGAIVGATAMVQPEPFKPVLVASVRVAALLCLLIGLAGVYAWPVLHPDHTLRWGQFAAEVRPGDRILSEDASVPVSLGQTPQVFDAFTLAITAKRDPAAVQPLIREISDKVFTKIFLTGRPESDTTGFFALEWGPAVVNAIDRNYHYDHTRANLFVYVPGNANG